VTAHGIDRVRSVTLRPADRPGRTPRSARTYACDTVCYAAGVRPADDLAYQALCGGSVVLAAPGAGTAQPTGRSSAVGTDATHGVASDAAAPAVPLLAGLAAGAVTAADATAQGEAAGKVAAERARRG